MNKTDANCEQGTKRPYVKPSFESERVFETNALSCAKAGATRCSSHPTQPASS